MKSFKRASTWDYLKNNTNVNNKEKSEKLERVKIKFPASKFLIFQSTIVSSVNLETTSNFLIDTLSNDYVNRNGECWSNESLKNNYKSFIGAYACLDHPDDPSQDNLGVILDAVLRKRWTDKENGKYIYYCDILVAIERSDKNKNVVKNIANNTIKYMSMGCNVKYSYCSKCGYEVDYVGTTSRFANECDHLKYSKGKRFVDGKGNERITAELLGKDIGSVTFVEASVLSSAPAFYGAALSRIYPLSTTAKFIEMEFPQSSIEKGAVKKYLTEKQSY